MLFERIFHKVECLDVWVIEIIVACRSLNRNTSLSAIVEAIKDLVEAAREDTGAICLYLCHRLVVKVFRWFSFRYSTVEGIVSANWHTRD